MVLQLVRWSECVRSLCWTYVASTAGVIAQAPLVHYDFEKDTDLVTYHCLQVSKDCQGSIVAPGAGGGGNALFVTNTRPSRYATATFKLGLEHVSSLVLSFDYRAEVETGGKAAYVGILFFDADEKHAGDSEGWWKLSPAREQAASRRAASGGGQSRDYLRS